MVNKNCNTPIPRRRGWNFFGFVASDYTGLVASAATSVVASRGLSAVPNPALGGLPTDSVIGCIGGGAASISYTIGKKL